MSDEYTSLEEGFSKIFTHCFAKTAHAHEFLIIIGMNENPGQEQKNYAAVLSTEGNPSKEGYLRKEDFTFSRSSLQPVESSEIKKMQQNAIRIGIGSVYLPATDEVAPGAEYPSPEDMGKLVEVHFDKAAEGFLMSYLRSNASQERMLSHNMGISRRKNLSSALDGLSQEERLGKLEEVCGRVKDASIDSLHKVNADKALVREFKAFADEVETYRGLLPNQVVDTLVGIVKPQINIYSANAGWITNKCMVSSLRSFTQWAREYCSLNESNAAEVGRLHEEIDDCLAGAFPIGEYERITSSEALTEIGVLCEIVTDCFETECGAGTDKFINDLDFLLEEAETYKSVLPYGAIELFEQIVRPVPNIFSKDSPWLINQNIPEAMEAYKKWVSESSMLKNVDEPAELKRRTAKVEYWRKKVDAVVAGGLAVE